ncbi:YIP1 family protein [Myxococcus hansupus]|uniref:YIP1 family protein n=1 Tax=Pseudomyxococcus hansupus TaxID=1297742 RepID=UPI000272B3D5|nr:Yip1 family protein [Myxococcus hansupus]
MSIPCPRCQALVVPGVERCAWCGNSLVMEATPGSSDPVCAVHPELRSLHACARCGSFACAKCLRKGYRDEPLCASCHERVPEDALPWDQRAELGTLKAFWQTCLAVLFRPSATLERARPDGSVGSSLGFAALSYFVGYFTTILLYMTLVFAIPRELAESDNINPDAMRLMWLGLMCVGLVMAPVMGVATTIVNSGLDHLVFRLQGTGQPFSVTLRANALSLSPFLVGLIPLCGAYVSPLWSLGLRIYAYRALHRTNWGTAALGALAVPLLSCGLVFGLYAVLLLVGLSMGGGR